MVSSPNLEKDLAEHRRLAKATVGTPSQFAYNGLLEQLQDEYSASGMDILYPEENLPMGFLGGPDQPLKLPEEPEIPPLLQETQNHPEFPEEAESFSPQVEAQAQPPEPPEETETSPIQQEAPVQPAECPEEAGPTPVQPEAPTLSAECPEEAGPTTVQPEASTPVPEFPVEDLPQISLSDDMMSPSIGHNFSAMYIWAVTCVLTGQVKNPNEIAMEMKPGMRLPW